MGLRGGPVACPKGVGTWCAAHNEARSRLAHTVQHASLAHGSVEEPSESLPASPSCSRGGAGAQKWSWAPARLARRSNA